MVETVNQKPTKTLQSKARSLFSFLCSMYGVGDEYRLKIPKYVGEFLMQPLQEDGKDIGCIGIKDEGYLVIIVGFNEAYPYAEGASNELAFEITAGKLCPQSETLSYPSRLIIGYDASHDGILLGTLHVNNVVAHFGQATAIEEFSTGKLDQKSTSSLFLWLEYRFDRKIVPSKGGGF